MGNVAEALGRLMRAQGALEEAKKSCEYDWGYFLHREIDEVKEAERSFIDAIKTEISGNPHD